MLARWPPRRQDFPKSVGNLALFARLAFPGAQPLADRFADFSLQAHPGGIKKPAVERADTGGYRRFKRKHSISRGFTRARARRSKPHRRRKVPTVDA
jgi:hypothetical protein